MLNIVRGVRKIIFITRIIVAIMTIAMITKIVIFYQELFARLREEDASEELNRTR